MKRSGTQSIERAILLLKELSSRGSFGWRLSDLAQRCQMDVGTTHRILACLGKERLVHRRPSDRHYLPGPMLFELGLSQTALLGFQAACADPLRRIAAQYPAVVSVYMRSGADCVCSGHVGSSPIKAVSTEVGTRRPLMASAAGLAILIALPKPEAKSLVADNLRRVAHLGATRVRALEKMFKNSAQLGYGIHDGEIVPGVSAFGVPIFGPDGSALASLGMSGDAATLPPSRADEFIASLKREAKKIMALSTKIQEAPPQA